MIKKEIFEEDLQQLARFAKTISQPAQLAILMYLAKTNVLYK